jgi:phospholipid-transporting ATPase
LRFSIATLAKMSSHEVISQNPSPLPTSESSASVSDVDYSSLPNNSSPPNVPSLIEAVVQAEHEGNRRKLSIGEIGGVRNKSSSVIRDPDKVSPVKLGAHLSPDADSLQIPTSPSSSPSGDNHSISSLGRGAMYQVDFNRPDSKLPGEMKYPSNYIKTNKYTIFSFLPLNLFGQVREGRLLLFPLRHK